MNLPLGVAVALTVLSCLTGVAQPQPLDAHEQNRQLGRGVNIVGYDPIWRSRDQARAFRRNISDSSVRRDSNPSA